MAIELQGQKIAFLATDGVEQVELKEPWKAVADAGGEPELLSIKEGEIQGFDHLCGRREGSDAHVVAEPANRYPKRRRQLGGRGGRGRRGPGLRRRPDDLPAFCAKIVELFADGTPFQPAEKTSASR
jgi:hypothetical protein